MHFADTDHFDPSVRGVMDNRENLEALGTSGFSDIAIEAPHWLQRWNDKLVDGAVTRPEFEENIHRALSGSQGNEDGSWTRQIGTTAEYARDNGMRFHLVWSAARALLGPGELIVGWYHSHPGLSAFFSDTDRRTQAAFFHHDYRIGWVIDPWSGDEALFIGPDSRPVGRGPAAGEPETGDGAASEAGGG